MNTDIMRVAKAIAALVVLFILLSVVMNWYGDYKAAKVEAEQTPTATAPPSGEETKTGEGKKAEPPAEKPKTVVVLIEGLNMRDKPAADGKRIRGLGKGDKLVLIKTEEDWYQVRASDKKVGWVSANPQYTKIEE